MTAIVELLNALPNNGGSNWYLTPDERRDAAAEKRAEARGERWEIEQLDPNGRDADWNYVREFGDQLTRGGW